MLLNSYEKRLNGNCVWMYLGNGWQVFTHCCRALSLPDSIFLTEYYLFHGKNEPSPSLLLNHCNYHRTKLNNAFCKLEMKNDSVYVWGRYLTYHFAAFLGWNWAAIKIAPHKYVILWEQNLSAPPSNKPNLPRKNHLIHLKTEGRWFLSSDQTIGTSSCHCWEGERVVFNNHNRLGSSLFSSLAPEHPVRVRVLT